MARYYLVLFASLCGLLWCFGLYMWTGFFLTELYLSAPLLNSPAIMGFISVFVLFALVGILLASIIYDALKGETLRESFSH